MSARVVLQGLLLLVVASTLLVSLVQSAEGNNADQLLLRILAPTPTVCQDKKEIEIEVEMRNVTGHVVTFAADGIGARLSYIAYEEGDLTGPGVRVGGETADLLEPTPDLQVITLEPGQSYRTTLKLPLDDEFFEPVGFYKVTVGFRGYKKRLAKAAGDEDMFDDPLQSNPVFFRIEHCDAGNGETEQESSP